MLTASMNDAQNASQTTFSMTPKMASALNASRSSITVKVAPFSNAKFAKARTLSLKISSVNSAALIYQIAYLVTAVQFVANVKTNSSSLLIQKVVSFVVPPYRTASIAITAPPVPRVTMNFISLRLKIASFAVLLYRIAIFVITTLSAISVRRDLL